MAVAPVSPMAWDLTTRNNTMTRCWSAHGIKILVDAQSIPYLRGLEIDYKESVMGGGFTLHNPNAVATCGCGQSFRTATDAGKPEEC